MFDIKTPYELIYVLNLPHESSTKVASVVNKMREARLRWLGYVKRKCINTPVRRCVRFVTEDTRRVRGRRKSIGEM